MTRDPDPNDPAAWRPRPGRLYVYSGGFLNRRLRRILTLAGWDVTTGRPGADDTVGVWGRSPVARRGEAVAARNEAQLVRLEDAFLRSVRTGREGDPPLGLMIDGRGVHFDSAQPSDLEVLLARHPLDDHGLLTRARDGIARMRRAELSKYNGFDTAHPVPEPGYVLVVDQTAGDASIRHSGATAAQFKQMLGDAQIDHPGQRIVVKTHPETMAGHRGGHFNTEDANERVTLFDSPASPWALLEGATAVYTLSSQLGFEAVLAGHRPHVYGQPWYAGWGLTEDKAPVARRTRRLTRAQLFAAAMLLAPVWYDPCRDRLCQFEDALNHLEAQVLAYRTDRRGYVATGMRAWKRGHLQRMFGRERRLRFAEGTRAVGLAAARSQPVMCWAGQVTPELAAAAQAADVPLLRVEDGLLRSRGLGAALVPPLSLMVDDLGVYYDPNGPSRVEQLIAASADLDEAQRTRAQRLIRRLTAARLTKYNLGGSTPDVPTGHRVLVPGQVEDDASIQLGCGNVRTNRALLEAARKAHPNAVLIYKPHPDVEAGLRPGTVPDAHQIADVVATAADPAGLLDLTDDVWTMTSGLGFEALLRGRRVSCLGVPFYAGWGLTNDLGDVPARRDVRVPLEGLVHAMLIAAPRYHDPVSGLPCPVEVIVDRLASGDALPRSPTNRLLAKAQGWAAGRFGAFWR